MVVKVTVTASPSTSGTTVMPGLLEPIAELADAEGRGEETAVDGTSADELALSDKALPDP